MKPIPGHALRFEGRCPSPHDRSRLWNGTGHGRCECGGRSPELPNTAARKRWHREHKAQIVALIGAVRQRVEHEQSRVLEQGRILWDEETRSMVVDPGDT